MNNKLILSLFPGVGLLDRAFEEAGFCVVRGPDTLWGGDIRHFSPPEGVFWGTIGGSPCQDFSGLRRIPPTGNGIAMMVEFARVVTEAKPEWYMLENVARAPSVTGLGSHVTVQLRHNYTSQRLDINQAWYCDVTRLRHIQFGSLSGRLLNITPGQVTVVTQPAALANDDRTFRELCTLQGLPDDYDLPGFLATEKKRAVGNGVPLQLGRVLAQAVIDAYAGQVTDSRRCACGCGRPVTGNKLSNNAACRKRKQRNRDKLFSIERGK
jgi:DNA (cytosine-5)-methyltransferase 1